MFPTLSSLRLSCCLGLLTLLGTSCQRSWEFDSTDVRANYQFRHAGDCNAWAFSPITGYRYCASPRSSDTDPSLAAYSVAAAPAFASVKEGPTDTAALTAHGQAVYTAICAACHQAEGQGMPGTFPPLAGAGGYYGGAENHARIIVHGLTGPIEVAGVAYNSSMPPQGAALSDYDIAAVATFERTSWGNADGAVLPEQVAAVR